MISKDSVTENTDDPCCISIAKYNIHTSYAALENLHRIQINDIAGLRTALETRLALDVQILWDSIQDGKTTEENRKMAYSLLRLIAIQNEKFPIPALNEYPNTTAILQSALQDDTAHMEWLRRQDWSKPKWVNRVD